MSAIDGPIVRVGLIIQARYFAMTIARSPSRPDDEWIAPSGGPADITYIPMARGFLYLVVVMDWYSPYVLARRLSNTMDTSFCLDALEDAQRQGRPEIFNNDQGSNLPLYSRLTNRLFRCGVGKCTLPSI
jgi:transposase InsO family protein